MIVDMKLEYYIKRTNLTVIAHHPASMYYKITIFFCFLLLLKNNYFAVHNNIMNLNYFIFVEIHITCPQFPKWNGLLMLIRYRRRLLYFLCKYGISLVNLAKIVNLALRFLISSTGLCRYGLYTGLCQVG